MLLAAIGLALYVAIMEIPAGGTSVAVSALAASTAFGTIDSAVAYTAIEIAVAAGGIRVIEFKKL